MTQLYPPSLADRVLVPFVGLVVVLFVTHADMFLALVEQSPVRQPTRLYLYCFAPLLAFWTTAQLAQPERLLGPFAAVVDNRLPIFALALLAAIALVPGAMLPGANWDDGATQIIILPYALIALVLGLMLGGCRPVRAWWPGIVLVAWLVAVVTIVVELFVPGYFASLIPPDQNWATARERAAGVMGDANTAAFIAISLAALLLRYDRLRGRDALLLVLTLLAVLATQSRGGLLLFLLLAGGYLLLTREALKGANLALTVLGTIGAVAFLIGVLLPSLSGLAGFSDWEGQRRLQMLTFQRDLVPEDESRVGLVADYLELIEERAFIGHGTGFMRRLPTGAHNIYMRYWLDNGVAGLLAYMAFLGSAALLLWHRRFWGGLIFVGLATLQGFFSHTLLDSRGFLLLLALALAVSRDHATDGHSRAHL
jgi:O-antigen ligase